MLKKRIIPCLDIKNGKVVKGINFLNLKELGDPLTLVKEYYTQGADEIVLLDIAATIEGRKILFDLMDTISRECYIPLTIGGGIKSIEDIRNILRAGADKVAINSAAIDNPQLIKDAADIFGSQCIVLAVDVKYIDNSWRVFTHAGTKDTGLDYMEWISTAEKLGAGELLVTSMDRDGTKNGYDLDLYIETCDRVNIPVIASGGVGSINDMYKVLKITDAALAASLFHYGQSTISETKIQLKKRGLEVRIC